MGYFNPDPRYPASKSYTPDDEEDCFYIRGDTSIGEIWEIASDKWGIEDMKFLLNLQIKPEYIHTSCIGYDIYDPSDYTLYLKIFR
jgi:hypothetical protein